MVEKLKAENATNPAVTFPELLHHYGDKSQVKYRELIIKGDPSVTGSPTLVYETFRACEACPACSGSGLVLFIRQLLKVPAIAVYYRRITDGKTKIYKIFGL